MVLCLILNVSKFIGKQPCFDCVRGGKIELTRFENFRAGVGSNNFMDAASLANKISEKLSEPIDCGEQAVCCPASIGIAIFPDDTDKYDKLLELADVALYRVKSDNSLKWSFFEHRSTDKRDG